MCFSTQASFVAAAVLIPTGGLCVYHAINNNKNYLPLAIIPLFFGIQQFMEGQVWLQLGQQDEARAILYSYGFVFFALFLWPFLFPYASYRIETTSKKKKLFHRLTLFMLAYGSFLYATAFSTAG